MPRTQINLNGWQDFRGDHAGVLIYIETSHQSAVPVRDQLNENGRGHFFEPNYETSTFNMMSCYNPRAINSIIKNKHRYILFGTRYEGFLPEFKGKYLIMGYMRIDKIKDMRSRHIQKYLSDPQGPESECMTLNEAFACWTGDMRFASLADSFFLTDEVMKSWGYKGRPSRQMKLLVEGEKLDKILHHFAEKPDLTDEYILTAEEFRAALEARAQQSEVNENTPESEEEEW